MLKFNHGVFQILHVAESGGMQIISNGKQCSDLPSLYRWIGFIQRPTFKVIHTLYRGIDIQMFGLQPKVATPKLRRATISQACVWFIATLVACHTFLATWSTCHRLNFLPNLATLVAPFVSHIFFGKHRGCLVLGLAMPHFIIQCCQRLPHVRFSKFD